MEAMRKPALSLLNISGGMLGMMLALKFGKIIYPPIALLENVNISETWFSGCNIMVIKN